VSALEEWRRLVAAGEQVVRAGRRRSSRVAPWKVAASIAGVGAWAVAVVALGTTLGPASALFVYLGPVPLTGGLAWKLSSRQRRWLESPPFAVTLGRLEPLRPKTGFGAPRGG